MKKIWSELNEEGRFKLQLMLGVFLVLLLIAMVLPQAWIFAAVAPIVMFFWFKSALHEKLKDKIFGELGFTKFFNKNILDDYKIGKENYSSWIGYQGVVDGQAFKIIPFSVTRGSGKNKSTYGFIGVEFETQKIHASVQIFDKKNPLTPIFKFQNQLESNEFHRYFKVYSSEPEDPFHFLDPDSMHDLMSLRKAYNYPINMESFANRIFIYVRSYDLEKEFKRILTFVEILNGTVSADKLGDYRKAIDGFVRNQLKIFQILDYKLATKEKKEAGA
ncbi:MAG TPA: DUF3137 domain-containing protein [Candidatus Binatia bacterium]|nr:DUF3137 domain-containing protein [Candidatus Binatia bacterium]